MKRLLMIGAMIFSAASFADGFKVGLGGYCPVGFVKAGKPVFGDPNFASEYKGTTYYNSSEGAKKMFDADPESFVGAVQFKGFCATGLAMGKKLESDPKIFERVNGKVYFFSSTEALQMFSKNSKKYIADADKAWAKLPQE